MRGNNKEIPVLCEYCLAVSCRVILKCCFINSRINHRITQTQRRRPVRVPAREHRRVCVMLNAGADAARILLPHTDTRAGLPSHPWARLSSQRTLARILARVESYRSSGRISGTGAADASITREPPTGRTSDTQWRKMCYDVILGADASARLFPHPVDSNPSPRALTHRRGAAHSRVHGPPLRTVNQTSCSQSRAREGGGRM